MMHDDQVHIDVSIVRQLIDDQFPQYRQEDIVPVESLGTVNAIFRIGNTSAARFPLRAMDPIECADLLRREATAMEELAELCPFPSPRSLGIGEPGPLYPMPWTVQTWIEGDVATPVGLSGSTTFARDLIHLVSALRQGEVRGRRFDGEGRGGDLTDHDDWMEVCFKRSEGLLDVSRLRHLWARFRELPSAGPDVMSHRDLTSANLLVRGEHLVGVLDGGSFGPADPALDLVAGWHLLDRQRRATFRDGVQVGELEWRRGGAWAFQQAMGLVWYYRITNPYMSALGRSTISRLLDDPDI